MSSYKALAGLRWEIAERRAAGTERLAFRLITMDKSTLKRAQVLVAKGEYLEKRNAILSSLAMMMPN